MDGKLSADEAVAAANAYAPGGGIAEGIVRARHAAMDTNKDGVVDVNEALAYQGWRPAGGAGASYGYSTGYSGGGASYGYATGGGGGASYGYSTGGAMGYGNSAQAIVNAHGIADANKDGKLSADEAVAAARAYAPGGGISEGVVRARHAAMDTNKDGVVDVNEALASQGWRPAGRVPGPCAPAAAAKGSE